VRLGRRLASASCGADGHWPLQWRPYSPRCSCTMRTARSRISGEKRFDFLFMVPSSQSLEPPRYPGRFIYSPCSDVEMSSCRIDTRKYSIRRAYHF
jgi:hypothetical protein